MDADDRPVGRVLTRREALKVLGATGAALAVACSPEVPATDLAADTATAGGPEAAAATATRAVAAVPSCVVRPEMTEGPYFVDEGLLRSDIRSDPGDGSVKEGALLELIVNVSRVSGSGCTPLEGVTVDIWHCDALGVYSDVSDPGFSTLGQKFLRGYQITDANGQARFTTIYPGWYQGRTVHIHFKIRHEGYEFTSQWYFDDSLSDEVFQQEPYAAKGERGTRNENDGIYRNGGDQLMLAVVPSGAGYAAAFDIGLQM